MFVSQGQSGSHLLKKLGWGLPDSGGMAVSGSGCCASHPPVALPVDGVCRTPADFLGVFNGMLAVGTAGCGLGVAGATGAVAGAADAGLTGNIPGEDSGVAGATSVLIGMSDLTACLDDVHGCDHMHMSVLASANDLNQVGAMSGLMDDCGWEPEGLGIIEYRDSLPCI